MTKKSVTALQKEKEFGIIVEDLKGVITEGVFHARWTLIETYHAVGEILVKREKECPKDYIKKLSFELKQKERLLYQCAQFYRKFPDIQKLPQGKNISWHKIANDLLPEHKEKKKTKGEKSEKIEDRLKNFFQVKSIPAKDRPRVSQVIIEWENFMEELK